MPEKSTVVPTIPDVFNRSPIGSGSSQAERYDPKIQDVEGKIEDLINEKSGLPYLVNLVKAVVALKNLHEGKPVTSPSIDIDGSKTRFTLGLDSEDYIPNRFGVETKIPDFLGLKDSNLRLEGGWSPEKSNLGVRGVIPFHQGGVIDAPPLPRGDEVFQPRIQEVAAVGGAWQPLRQNYGPTMQMGGLVSQLMRPEIYGRGEDTMLMHVTPGEIKGLSSLFPGAITQNPYTGYPEAFKLSKILPFLALAAAAVFTGGAAAAPALGGGWMAAGGAGTAAGFSGAAAAATIPAAAGLAYPAMTGAQLASASAPYAASLGALGGGAAIPGLQGLSYGMGQQALASPALGAMKAGISQPLMHFYGPQAAGVGGMAPEGFSGTIGQPTEGIDWGDTAKRLAKQAAQLEEEELPPPPPMPAPAVEPGKPPISMEELLKSIPSGGLPERETEGLGLEDVTDDELIAKLLEDEEDEEDEEGEEAEITDDELADLLMPGFRKGGPVEGLMVGPSSIIPQGGGLVLGGEMDDDVFKIDGVHTQIYDGGEAVQEARLNNGEVVMSAGAVTGLGKALGAQPNEEIQTGADFLMQIQQRGEAMNNDDHRSPTNLRPSYGFGLA